MKTARQETILKVIASQDIETQNQLMQALLELGVKSTQATLSRDIKDLRLVKELASNGRYRYAPALEPLLTFVRQKDPEQWEYVTVSASALSRYPGEATFSVLKEALHSANWYVRYAAAASLNALGAGYEDLLDIISGSDRYAREMVMYRLESRRMQKVGASEP